MSNFVKRLLNTVKGLFYVFLIGAIYYFGGFGWALLFTRNKSEREKVGMINLLELVLEITLLIIIMLIDISKDPPIYEDIIEFRLIDLMIVHFLVSFAGNIIYFIWWIFSGNE
jgi:hypothetical protein